MANEEHLAILRQGLDKWNEWRTANVGVKPDFREVEFCEESFCGVDLSGVDLTGAIFALSDFSVASFRGANLSHADLRDTDFGGADFGGANLTRANLGDETNFRGADFSEANLRGANLEQSYFNRARFDGADLCGAFLSEANLTEASLVEAKLASAILDQVFFDRADLSGAVLRNTNLTLAFLTEANLTWADLSKADLYEANFSWAVLVGADLRRSNLSGVNFRGADLSKADLSGSNLRRASLIQANLRDTKLSDCDIFGVSVWDLQGLPKPEDQINLNIASDEQSMIMVDDIEVAQFIYMLLDHKKLRNVINAVTDKGVLLLGRFGDGGIDLLHGIANRLRELGYLPIIFDFDRPEKGNYIETVRTLAGLSRFVVANLTNHSSIPQELQEIVPTLKIPCVPIIEKGCTPWAMAVDILEYPWVIGPPIIEFETKEELIKMLPEWVIAPAEDKHQERQKLLDQIFKGTK